MAKTSTTTGFPKTLRKALSAFLAATLLPISGSVGTAEAYYPSVDRYSKDSNGWYYGDLYYTLSFSCPTGFHVPNDSEWNAAYAAAGYNATALQNALMAPYAGYYNRYNGSSGNYGWLGSEGYYGNSSDVYGGARFAFGGFMSDAPFTYRPDVSLRCLKDSQSASDSSDPNLIVLGSQTWMKYNMGSDPILAGYGMPGLPSVWSLSGPAYVNLAASGSAAFTGTNINDGSSGLTTTYEYQLDGTGSTWTSAGSATSPITSASRGFSTNLSAVAEGSHTMYFRARNANGNSNIVSAAFTKDTVAPTLTVSAPAYVNLANSGAVSVSGSCSENGRTVSVSAGSASATPTCSAGAWNVSLDLRSAGQGNVTVSASQTDLAGNSGSDSATVRFNAPPSPSALRVNGLASPVGIPTLYPTFSWTFSDPDAGDLQSAYRLVVTASGSATPSWDSGKVASSASSAGYVGNNLALDGTEYVWSASLWDSSDSSGTATGAFSMLGAPSKPSASVSSVSDSGVSFAFSDGSSGRFAEDSVDVLDGSGNVVSNLPADSVSYVESGLSPNSAHSRSFCPKNAAWRNCSDAVSFVTYASAPTAVSAVPGRSGSSFYADVSWSVASASEVEVSESGSVLYSGPSSGFRMSWLVPDSVHSLEIRSVNSAGVRNPTASSVTFRALPGIPDVAPSRPVGTWFNSGVVGIVNSASGVASYYWKADKSPSYSPDSDDAAWTDLSAPISFAPDSDGDWYLHLTPVGSSGAVGQSADFGPWHFDATPPAAIDVTKFHRTSFDSVSLSGTCSYEPGATVVVNDNLVPIGTFAVTDPCRISWNRSGLAAGSHDLSVSVVDMAGNASAPVTLSFLVSEDGSIDTPKSGETVGTSFSVTGFGKPNSTVSVFDGSDNVIASGATDGNGFYAVQTYARPLGPLVLGVSVDGNRSSASASVTVASDSVRTPRITNVPESGQITTKVPSIGISGEPGSRVRVFSKDSSGNLTDIGGTVLDPSGSGTVVSEAEFSLGENVVFAIDEIYGLSSSIRYVVFVDPWGYVYDSVTRRPIQGAKVTVLDASGSTVSLPSLHGVPQPNPMYTDADGYYGSYELPGTYRIVVEKDGYSFPSSRVASGSANLDGTANVGSHWQLFTVSTQILHIDFPMDPVVPAVARSSGGGSGAGGAWNPPDYCPNGDYSASYYDKDCGDPSTAIRTLSGTAEAAAPMLELRCEPVDSPYFYDATRTEGMDAVMERLISCGIVENGLVLRKDDPVYVYDVLRTVSMVEGEDLSKYSIPKGRRAFSDLPKTYADAKLAYRMAELGYLKADKAGRAKIYSRATPSYFAQVVMKTFGYDARPMLRGKKTLTLKDYLAVLYAADRHSKTLPKQLSSR